MTYHGLGTILWFFMMNGILQFGKHLDHLLQSLGIGVGFQAGRSILDEIKNVCDGILSMPKNVENAKALGGTVATIGAGVNIIRGGGSSAESIMNGLTGSESKNMSMSGKMSAFDKASSALQSGWNMGASTAQGKNARDVVNGLTSGQFGKANLDPSISDNIAGSMFKSAGNNDKMVEGSSRINSDGSVSAKFLDKNNQEYEDQLWRTDRAKASLDNDTSGRCDLNGVTYVSQKAKATPEYQKAMNTQSAVEGTNANLASQLGSAQTSSYFAAGMSVINGMTEGYGLTGNETIQHDSGSAPNPVAEQAFKVVHMFGTGKELGSDVMQATVSCDGYIEGTYQDANGNPVTEKWYNEAQYDKPKDAQFSKQIGGDTYFMKADDAPDPTRKVNEKAKNFNESGNKYQNVARPNKVV